MSSIHMFRARLPVARLNLANVFDSRSINLGLQTEAPKCGSRAGTKSSCATLRTAVVGRELFGDSDSCCTSCSADSGMGSPKLGKGTISSGVFIFSLAGLLISGDTVSCTVYICASKLDFEFL